MISINNFTLGICGDGQLAKLLADKARSINFNLHFLSPAPESSPCAGYGKLFFIKDWEDEKNFYEFAQDCDVLILENEFIPLRFLEYFESIGKTIIPNVKSYKALYNKKLQVELANNLDFEIPRYQTITHPEDLTLDLAPCILKAIRGGYDGYGNFVFDTPSKLSEAKKFISQAGICLAQEIIDIEAEIAIIIARDETSLISFPAAQTLQENNICHYVIAPPLLPNYLVHDATELAKKIIQAIDGIGVFGVEFFISKGKVIFNEIAPRAHNSGHFSIDACEYSQFDSILKIINHEKLSPVTLMPHSVGMLNLLGTQNAQASFVADSSFEKYPKRFLHLYGKKLSRSGRKMGHFTFYANNSLEALSDLKNLKQRYQI